LIKTRRKKRKTHSRLNRNDTTRRQLPTDPQVAEQFICILVVRVTARVMSVHAEVVAQAVREESHTRARLENVFLVSFQDAQGEEAVNGDLVCSEVHVVPQDTFLEHVGGDALHLEDYIVDGPALRAEFAGYRKGSGLVRKSARCVDVA
jgi:hypothetical protein